MLFVGSIVRRMRMKSFGSRWRENNGTLPEESRLYSDSVWVPSDCNCKYVKMGAYKPPWRSALMQTTAPLPPRYVLRQLKSTVVTWVKSFNGRDSRAPLADQMPPERLPVTHGVPPVVTQSTPPLPSPSVVVGLLSKSSRQ